MKHLLLCRVRENGAFLSGGWKERYGTGFTPERLVVIGINSKTAAKCRTCAAAFFGNVALGP
jgi:hypothetical protein